MGATESRISKSGVRSGKITRSALGGRAPPNPPSFRRSKVTSPRMILSSSSSYASIEKTAIAIRLRSYRPATRPWTRRRASGRRGLKTLTS